MRTTLLTLIGICYIFFFYEKVTAKTHYNLWVVKDKYKFSKTDSIADYYIDKSYEHFKKNNIDSLKLYLDSVSFYEKKVISPIILGDYYNLLGLYYSFKQKEIESHQCYYNAIDFYEKAEKPESLIPIYQNLAFSYIQKHDTKSLENIINKMRTIALKQENISYIIKTYSVISFYFNCLYEKDYSHVAFLDSAIYYDKQIISLYENNKNVSIEDEEIAYNYINLASNLLRRKEFKIETLSTYLNTVERLIAKDDTVMLINKLWLNGEIEYYKDNIVNAKEVFIEQLDLMNNWSPTKDLSIYLKTYDRLTEIAEKQSNYKEAFQYQLKKVECLQEIHDIQKYESIREVETRYEVEKKEQEIIQLTERNNFQKTINNLYLYLFLLAGTAFYLFFRWRKQKDKATKTQLALTELEKEDAILKIELQEKELEKMELEKYEALLDSHFKEGKLSEMNEEVKDLKKIKNQLNAQIEEFAEKVKEYENRKAKDHPFATYDAYYTTLVQEVYKLICKWIPDIQKKEEYIESLLQVDDRFFEVLMTKTTENLSSLDLQHCICCYINMQIKDMEVCFNKENSTIRQIRTRLKEKFNIVGKKIDINRYLKQISG